VTKNNINRKNKGGLSSDSGGLSRSESAKYGITGKYGITLVYSDIIDIVVMMTHRDFFVFDGGQLAVYSNIKDKLRIIIFPVKENTRYHGVILDQELNFSKHINISLEKAKTQLNRI